MDRSFLLEDIVDEATGRVIIPAKDWAFDPAEGSQFLDWGVHETDALRWLTGSEVVRVYADYQTFGTPPPVDLTAQVQVTMANGVMAQMLMTYETPEPGLVPNDWTRIIGSKGIIEADHYGAVNLGDADPAGESPTSRSRSTSWATTSTRTGSRVSRRRSRTSPRRSRTDREPVVTGRDGRAAVEIVEAADRSAATHQAVTLPLSG